MKSNNVWVKGNIIIAIMFIGPNKEIQKWYEDLYYV